MEMLNIKLESFEGPFDLLYHLIEKNEINIYDIPISSLTDQYINFIAQGHKNMDTISEFVLMAATLLEIKSKMLLPKPKNESNEEIDPRAELVAKLEEYKKFKLISEDFRQKEEVASKCLYKKPQKILLPVKQNISIEDSLKEISLNDLYNTFVSALASKELKTDKIRSSFNSIERDLFTIEDKINYLKDILQIFPNIKFSHIFNEQTLKIEIVVTFLALLELIKMKIVYISQNNIFDEIILTSAPACSE